MGKKRKKKKVLLSGSDPFYLSKKLRRRRYGEVSAQTSQKSQNRALVKKKVAYRAPAAQACTPPTWTINRIFSKSEILAESLHWKFLTKKKKKKNIFFSQSMPDYWGGAIKVYVYFIRRELLLKWPKNEKGKKKKNHCYFGVASGRNLAKTPPLAFLGQSQPVVGSMWKNEQFFGDLNFHKSEPHQHQSCKN